LHAVLKGSSQECFLVLPHGTVNALLHGQPDGYNFRGRTLQLRRAGKGDTAALAARIDLHQSHTGHLPAERDPSEIIEEVMRRRAGLTTTPLPE
jgi:hypothetical protein